MALISPDNNEWSFFDIMIWIGTIVIVAFMAFFAWRLTWAYKHSWTYRGQVERVIQETVSPECLVSSEDLEQ